MDTVINMPKHEATCKHRAKPVSQTPERVTTIPKGSSFAVKLGIAKRQARL